MASEDYINPVPEVFRTFKVSGGAVDISMHPQGQRFLFSYDDGPGNVLSYNQNISIPSGFDNALFVTKHYSLSFKRVSEKGESPDLYLITESIDTRSFDGQLIKNYKQLTISGDSYSVTSNVSADTGLPSSIPARGHEIKENEITFPELVDTFSFCVMAAVVMVSVIVALWIIIRKRIIKNL